VKDRHFSKRKPLLALYLSIISIINRIRKTKIIVVRKYRKGIPKTLNTANTPTSEAIPKDIVITNSS
jgi:hypothetical protein